MGIGNILGNLTHKKEAPEQFLALVVTSDIVQAAVWSVIEGKTEVITTGTPSPWNGDEGKADDLVLATDNSISNAIEGLGEVPTKVIFGVPFSWTHNGGEIRPKERVLLKKICEELELKPLGLVMVIDSLVHYLKMEEGNPTTAIIIGVSDTDLTIAHIALGKTASTAVIGRSDDVAADVEEGISRVMKGLEHIPSRIIIFDGMHDLEEVRQSLMIVDWSKKFAFLHIPKIEVFPKDVLIRALSLAGGSEVAKSIGLTIAEKPLPLPITSNLVSTDINPEDFGFSNSDDSVQDSPKISEEVFPISKPKFQAFKKITFPKIKFPKLVLPKFSFNKPVVFVGGIILVIIILITSTFWLFPKATITITVVPEPLVQNLSIALDPNISTAVEGSGVVPATLVTGKADGSKSVSTTGTKKIGDPANGEVSIYNRTTLTKTFLKGTILTTNNLKFTLDSDVTIASKSAGSDYVDVPGKSNVKIVATAIGESSNLASGTEFILASFSKESYVAKNDKALTGGSSSEVRVVAKTDRDQLLADLKSELEEDAKNNLQNSGSNILVLGSKTKLTNETYSAKIGEESDNLSLELGVKVEGLSYREEDVVMVVKNAVMSSVPEDYIASSDLPSITLGESENQDVKVVATLLLLPKVDSISLAKQFQGKPSQSDEVTAIASRISGFSSVKVEVTPHWFPSRLKFIPRNPANISIQIVPKI